LILWSQNLQNQQSFSFGWGKHANRRLPGGDTVVEPILALVLQVLNVL
jgi:hypothetical protein